MIIMSFTSCLLSLKNSYKRDNMNEHNDFQFSIEDAINKYGELVRKLARLNTHTLQDAEDVFQEVFLKLFCNKEHINSEEHLKAWLIRVTINECNSKKRSAYRQREMPIGDTAYLEKNVEEVWNKLDDDEVYEKVKKLPKKYRDVVLLYYYENYSIKEIAQLLDINENTVKTRLARAKLRLAALITSLILLLVALLWLFNYYKQLKDNTKVDADKIIYTTDNLKEDAGLIVPERSGDEYIAVLPDGSEMVIEKSKLSVWECVDEETGSYALKLDSSDVEMSRMDLSNYNGAKNTLSAKMPEYQFIITDSAGHENECTAVQKEIGEDYYIYEITLYIDYFMDDNFNADWIKLQVKTDLDYNNPVIVGTYCRDEDGEYVQAEYEFTDDMGIHPVAFIRSIAYGEDGDILPFDEWEGMSEVYGGFALEGELGVKVEPITDINSVRCVFSLYDKDGNSYWTDISD